MTSNSKIVTEENFTELRYSAFDGRNVLPGIKVLRNEQVDTLRWVEMWEIVWSEDDGTKFFAYLYEIPATDEEGIESEFDPRGIYEVVPQEKIIIDYVRVKN